MEAVDAEVDADAIQISSIQTFVDIKPMAYQRIAKLVLA